MSHRDVDANRAGPDMGWTPLMEAVEQGRADIVTELLAHGGVDVNHEDRAGRTALMKAAEFGRVDCLRLLLEHECVDLDVRSHHGKAAMDYAMDERVRALLHLKAAESPLYVLK